MAGFQLGSKMTTLLAAVRLRPTPPASVEMRKMKVEGCMSGAEVACVCVCV